MSHSQSILSKRIKKKLIDKDLRQQDLIPYLIEKNPGMKIQRAHVSMALSGKYPSMLSQINKIIEEAA